MTPKQEQRQQHRDRGRYAQVNPCYHCGKSAGVDYVSHSATDTGGFSDAGLVLCVKCCEFLEGLDLAEALRRLRLANYGTNPQRRKV